MVIGETTKQAYAGMTSATGLSFVGAPGSTFKVSFDGNGIDESKGFNQDFMNETNTTSL